MIAGFDRRPPAHLAFDVPHLHRAREIGRQLCRRKPRGGTSRAPASSWKPPSTMSATTSSSVMPSQWIRASIAAAGAASTTTGLRRIAAMSSAARPPAPVAGVLLGAPRLRDRGARDPVAGRGLVRPRTGVFVLLLLVDLGGGLPAVGTAVGLEGLRLGHPRGRSRGSWWSARCSARSTSCLRILPVGAAGLACWSGPPPAHELGGGRPGRHRPDPGRVPAGVPDLLRVAPAAPGWRSGCWCSQPAAGRFSRPRRGPRPGGRCAGPAQRPARVSRRGRARRAPRRGRRRAAATAR